MTPSVKNDLLANLDTLLTRLAAMRAILAAEVATEPAQASVRTVKATDPPGTKIITPAGVVWTIVAGSVYRNGERHFFSAHVEEITNEPNAEVVSQRVGSLWWDTTGPGGDWKEIPGDPRVPVVLKPIPPAPAPTPTPTPAPLPSAGGARAVATFECLGLYWTPPAYPGPAGAVVQYRKLGDTAWKAALPLWYDARNKECRGSIVNLTSGATYEVQLTVPGKAVTSLTAKTWSESFPIGKTRTVAAGAQTLAITEGGTADGYVLYTAAPGTTIDVADKLPNCVTIAAPYVILRGLTLKGASRDAVELLAGSHDVVIEDCDISGWGRLNYTNDKGWKIGVDYEAGIRIREGSSVERVIIQRNTIHDPRYDTNSWSWDHPTGPQGITFDTPGGNHVIRYNDIHGSPGHYFNDGIGGSDNFTDAGSPREDSDIYGNSISHCWDDAIEAEGRNANVRIWGNYLDNVAVAVATTVTNRGPVYIFRNVENRSRMLSERTPDEDDRNTFAKSGTGGGFGDGRRYVFHNTLLQAPPPPGSQYPSGADSGISGPPSLTNTVSRNNIFQIWKSWHGVFGGKAGAVPNDLDYDLYNGKVPDGSEPHGVNGVPTYLPGHGAASEDRGLYQLAPGSPGRAAGVVLQNFSDGFAGAAPDMGAHESGAPAMRFGVKAGSKP